MRTVHETEALRPSDPVPKSMQSHSGKGSKLKIILKTQQAHSAGDHDSVDDGEGSDDISSDFFTALTEQQGFTAKEIQMDIESLWKLCVAHTKWAIEETEDLRKLCKDAEEVYRQEWLEKEVLLDQVKKLEEDWFKRRKAVLSGEADIQVGAIKSKEPGDDEPAMEVENGDETELEPAADKVAAELSEAGEEIMAE